MFVELKSIEERKGRNRNYSNAAGLILFILTDRKVNCLVEEVL
jgi:hypothetical protein